MSSQELYVSDEQLLFFGGTLGALHPGGTIQNCAMCSQDLSIVPLGSLQSFAVLLSQTP